MALQPPSFFEAPQHREGEEGHTAGGDVRSQYGGAVTVGQASSHDEIAALRQENQELKKCLRLFGHPPPTHELPTSPCVHHPNPTAVPVVLTNDLLQVEANLQSRVMSLEREKREASAQLLGLEHTLYQTKEHYKGQIEALRSQNEEALLQIQLENERLNGEYQALQEEKVARIKELDDELAAVQEQRASETEAMQARVADMEERNRALRSELEEEKVVHEREMAEVRRQLVEREGEVQQARMEIETQVSTLQRELSAQSGRVQQLEAYLGGELPSEESGVTWREERDILTTRIRDQEREGERLRSEAKLLNVRLASLSEILAIQESDTAKHMDNGSSGEGATGPVKSLLSRWREKVFVLLVQQKLQQIQDNRERLEARAKEQCLVGQRQQLEVEKELLSHALTDKTAELQLQTSKTEELEHRLDQACCTIGELEGQLQYQHEGAQHIGSCIQRMAEVYGHCKFSFDQALTRLANYEQRLVLVSRRVNSVNASLSCHFAILSHQPVHTTTMDATCQTEQEEVREKLDLTGFSREQLIHEVASLTRERDSLVKKLSDSTATFEQQLQSVDETCTLRVSVLEERVSRLQREKESVSEQLSEVVGRQSALEEEKDSLQEKVGQLEGQLRDTQATVEARLEAAVLEQQQRSGEELCEMEGLLNVAKREHAKAVVQLKELQRQVGRERERAVQAAEMSKAQVEHELESCQRKLQSVQAERNLLLTTLRLEGIVVPSKRPVPRPALDTSHYSEQDSESEYESRDGTTSVEASLLSQLHATPPESQSGMEEDPIPSSVYHRNETATERENVAHQAGLLPGNNRDMTTNGSTAVDAGGHMEAAEVEAGHEDIREVLKDLQLLSASLIGLETRTVTES